MRKLVRHWLPTRETLHANRRTRWLASLFDRPGLWRLDRRSIAAGLAIGVFWGVLLPVGQFLFAGVTALVLRANLPTALLGTFVSNPLTIAPTYVAAYYMGRLMVGGTLDEKLIVPPWESASGGGWIEHLASAGAPLLVGLAALASLAAAVAYLGTRLAWRIAVARSRARRRLAREHGDA